MKLFVTALRAAVGGFVTSGQIEEAEEFFKDKDTRQYARFLQQALEGARVNTKWVERDQALVAQWIGQSVKDEHQL
jgi:aminopeptidase 2